MKTPEELNALKEEVETLTKKLQELSEDELQQVSGGLDPIILPWRDFDSVVLGSDDFPMIPHP